MVTRRYNRFLLFSVLFVVISLVPLTSATLSITAFFNQSGISGTISFTQEAPDRNTTIDVNLTGLSGFPGNAFPFPWHVHEYPFPHDGAVTPCGSEITGGHFDPLSAATNPNYSTDCGSQTPERCEIGDLSGKFERFPKFDPLIRNYSDQFLSLYGVNSIIGRSIVIHFANGSRLVCANIGYPSSDPGGGRLLYSPFRNSFKGDIFFQQHSPDNSTSSVYTNLERVEGGENSAGHNWHVHDQPLDAAGTNCSIAGPHYNPRGVDISDQSYSVNCSSMNSTVQRNCEIGDLSNKGAPFNVVNRRIQQFYTDTDLPILPDIDGYSIDDRSIVIHAENGAGPRIDCANLTQYRPLEAVSVFNDEQGVTGSIRFYQRSPYDPTLVTVSLRGLQRRFNGYHVHEYPIGPANLGSPNRCGAAFTGGHWNPTGADISTPGRTSDQFEIGDLSGKFGGLSGLDELAADYTDPNVPLFGPFSVIGRSIVIHLDDQDGTRSVCSNIQRTRQILQVMTTFSSVSFSGNVTFSQPADDPYAETTITVAIDVNQMLQPPPPAVVSSSTPIEVTPTTTTMATSAITMTTSSVVTTEFLEASSSVATITSSVMMTSSGAPMLQPFTFSELPMSFTSQLARPEPTPVSSPSPSPSPLTSSTVDIGSGSDLLVPFSTDEITVSVAPTNMPSGRRRRGVDDEERRRLARQADGSGMAVPFEWSLRIPPSQGNSGAINPDNCTSLSTVDVFPSNPSLCSPTNQLACSAGDLTSKHGALLLPQQAGRRLRAVFTDSNLPLSGPRAIFQQMSDSNPLLLIQQMGGAMMSSQSTVCEQGGPATLMDAPTEPPPPITMAPPTSPRMTTVQDTPVPSQQDNTTVIIGAAVGGGIGAILLLILVLVILAVCVKRRGKNHYNLAQSTKIELGTINPSKPIIGIPNYKALYNYKPQNEGDLELVIGDWVTLKETPYGGNWWRGTIEGRGEGWFPKNYVKFVDVEAEKKKREAENFKLAAAAIVAASTSFNTRHPSLSRKKHDDVEVNAKPKRAQTFSRRDIDSTPKMFTKFDKPYLQTIEPPPDGLVAGMVIANSAPGSVGGSQPGTPASQRSASEVITNKVAMETGSSQEDNNEANKELETLNVNAEFLISEKYIAKYEFGGSTDIELQFKKGSVVTVIEKAENGWWKGICEGQVGWFPESYVRPPPKTETKAESNHTPNVQEERQQVEQPRGMDEMMASGDDLEASEYRAVFTYESETQGDLRFSEGEMVLVYWADENGWWFGSAGSTQGWFPGSYVEPVVESSEAGSVLASPVQLTQEGAVAEGEGEEGDLASELAAAIKKRKTKKEKGDSGGGEEKDTRSSFKKRWSLRRKSRDKNKGSPSANRTQESASQVGKETAAAVSETAAVTGAGEEEREMEMGGRDAEIASPDNERLLPNSNEGGGIQNELASAIIRRNSIGREATLSIDERLAKAKQQKDSEPQNDLLKALKKRKVSTEQSSSTPEKSAPTDVPSPTEKPPMVLENSNTGTGASQEDSQVNEPKPVADAANALATPTKAQEKPEERKEEETATTAKKPEDEQKAVPVTSSTTPTPHQQAPPRTPEAKARKSTVAGRPKRRPPPPPVGGATAVPQPPGRTADTPQLVASPANKLPSQAAQPSPKGRKTSAPSPLIHERAKPAAGQQVDKKPHPSRTAPEVDKSGRSYTTAAAAAPGSKQAAQPKGKGKFRPVKRQATAGDLKPKYPARRPPPPPPGTLTSPSVKQPGKPSPSTTAKKAVVTDSKAAAGASGTPQQDKKSVPPSRGTPVAPPRAKARVQKVKRPISRMIPPPPNIPLPPPPVRTTPPTATKTAENKTEVQQPQTSSTPPQNTNTPPVKAPRPRGPKPAPPTRVSSLTPEPLKKLRLTPRTPPTVNEATTTTSTENKTAFSTKPTTPPTQREKLMDNVDDSSSKTAAPIPAKRQQLPSSSKEEVKEETDVPLVTDSPLNRKATKSAPPERPPPPRPPSAASNASSKIGQVNPDKPDKPAATKPAKPERPPPSLNAAVSPTTKLSSGSSDAKQGGIVPLLSSSNQGKVLFDASAPPQPSTAATSGDSGNDAKPRGGGFMKSLKKIVKRDSGTTVSSTEHRTTAAEGNSNKTPPTKRTSTKKVDTSSQDGGSTAEPKSPPARPPPVSKVDHSITATAVSKPQSETTAKENGTAVTEQPKSPPARPPPILSQEHKSTTAVTAEPKPPPARPPPRKISSSEQTQGKREVKQESSIELKASEPNPPPAKPLPRKISTEQLQAKHESEQKAAEKKVEAVTVLKEELAPLNSEGKSEPIAPKPRPRKAEVADEKVVEKKALVEEPVPVEVKKEVKTVASGIPSRPPPPRTSPSEKRKVSIPARPPPPKTPVSKTSSSSLGSEQQNGPKSPGIKSPTTPIPEKPKPMPAPRKESQSDLLQKSNGPVNSVPIAPVPTPRQKSSSPTTPDEKSPTNPTGTNFYRALKDYGAAKDGELSFSTGDVLIFIERREKGFYYGMLDNGLTGLFPTSHVEPFFR